MRLIATGEERYKINEKTFPNFASVLPGTIVTRKSLLDRQVQDYGSYYGNNLKVFQTFDGFSTGKLPANVDFELLEKFVQDLLLQHEKLNSNTLVKNFSGLYIAALLRKLYGIVDNISELRELNGKWLIWNVTIANHGPPLRKPKSMKWHFDTHYPQNYPKLHIGFNEYVEHEGGTSFLTETVTREFVELSNYSGAPLSTRLEDLEKPFSEQEYFYKSELGSYAVFFPNRCLHKGKWPEKGRRKSVFLSLCPFPTISEKTPDLPLRLFYTMKILRYTDDIYVNDMVIDPSDYPVFFYP